MSEVFVIMEREAETGALLGELAGCEITLAEYVLGLDCVKEGKAYAARLTLGTGAAALEDWQYDAVFDYYDEAAFDGFDLAGFEEETGYGVPAWRFSLPFTVDRAANDDLDDVDELEKTINKLTERHAAEIESVMAAIADKKGDYE